MEHGQKLYMAESLPWPGATPFSPPVCGPNPLRGFGGTPGHGGSAPLPRSSFCRVRAFNIKIQTERGHRVIADDHYRVMRHLSYFAKEISDTKALVRPDVPGLGHQKASPQPRSTPSSTPVPSDQRPPSRPIYCQSLTTFLDHVSINKTQCGGGTVRGNAHSTNGSAASSTSGTRKCLQT